MGQSCSLTKRGTGGFSGPVKQCLFPLRQGFCTGKPLMKNQQLYSASISRRIEWETSTNPRRSVNRSIMPRSTEIRRLAFIGDYLPRKCGIATFTNDLRNSVASQYPATECVVVPVNDLEGGYDYPPE